MLEKFYVLVLSINKSGGNSQEITRHADYESAENKFYDKCSQLAGKRFEFQIFSTEKGLVVETSNAAVKGYHFTVQYVLK